MTRQKLGQHFLSDPGWRRRIFETLPRNAGDVWLEIGAGHGEMTQMLAGEGRRVMAVETDARLAAGLRERAREWPGVAVVAGDILSVDLGSLLGDLDLGSRVRVYGNLPYYITSPILHRLFEWAERIASIHAVIQFEVAVRIAARPGRRQYGYLSAACQFYSRPEIVSRIPPGAFRPAPKVTSALVRMTLPGERATLGVGDDPRFLKFVQTCFGQKRKTLRNNLRGLASDQQIQAALTPAGLRADARAEQLTLAEFAGLFKALT
jgi:16S rRNA (adenine1518-N6/adenine1519-N6)-dimethyltransferase